MEVGEYVFRDLNVGGLADAFTPATTVGREHLVKILSSPTTDVSVLAARQAETRDLRQLLRGPDREKIISARNVLRETETDVASVASAAADKRHAEYYNQILWAPKTLLGRLNEYGLITEAMVFFRTIFVPGMSVLLPLFVFIAPIVLYTFVLKRPISFSEYFDFLSIALKKAMPGVLGKPRFSGRGGFLESGEQLVHIGVSAAVFIGSIWSQVSSALSMRAVAADMRRRADSVVRMRDALATIDALRAKTRQRYGWEGGSMQIFGHAWNTPEHVQELLEEAAEVDAALSIALAKRTCFASYTDVSGECLEAEDVWHPGVSRTQRVYNSVRLGGARRRHVLLTGPNRGGKSTLLKSVGAAVLMGQTLGVVFARRFCQPVFSTITTALAPADVIGEKSLFESEIEFAMRVRERTGAGPMFLMMDEIFHGTNAHDGVEAAQIFLDDLYGRAGSIYSIVSTHYMDLPARYGDNKTQNLCMEASADPIDPDRLVYTYRLCEGVNRFSSVREILRERGLLVTGGNTAKC